MKIPLPVALKRRIKGHLKRWRMAWIRHRYGFGPEQFSQALQQLGLQGGETVLVHSDMDCFEPFSGRPTEIITQLEELLGPSGTLVMPTIPFSGSALAWVEEGGGFDNRLTPSRTGLLTEFFRRSSGVIRSQHPTHPVAAKGLRAADLCADHHLAQTPCGKGSPYHRLLAVDGWTLLLGSGMESMTFYHAVEEVIEDKMPFSPFTTAYYTIESRTQTGEMVQTRTRLFDPDLSRRRRISRLVSQLQSKPGRWREVDLGKMTIILLKASEVLAAAEEMALKGAFCYEE
ncbi:MAG: AAC(3) family N-acetyltransferase [Magnetococcales bacterium]|nr:AAC(3) family N-acetyltransferase [Magnetococcales bacterium]